MAWWRKPPSHHLAPEEPECAAKDQKLNDALAEADAALQKAKLLQAQQKTMGDIIRDIRERNHLSEIWMHDGMGA